MDAYDSGARAPGTGAQATGGLNSVASFMITTPGAELGPIPETDDIEPPTSAAHAETNSTTAPQPSGSGIQSHPYAPATGLHVDSSPPLTLNQRRGSHFSDGDQLQVDAMPKLPSLTIRTKVPTQNEHEAPSQPAHDNDGLLGYLSKGLGGIFATARPPKPSMAIPGTARSGRSVRSVYSSRSAFQRSAYQEQMNQQMETSVNNFSKFLKDKGHTFKGKMAAAMSDVGSNYDAMSAAPDSPFSTVMSTISEWNLPEHTEHAAEPHRNHARLDLSRIDRSVDTKLQLDRYLASQPSPYQVAPPSARDLQFVPEEGSPPTPTSKAHNNYFAESPHAHHTPSATPGPFALTPEGREVGTMRTPPSDPKSVPLTSPTRDQSKCMQQPEDLQPKKSSARLHAQAPPDVKHTAVPDLNLASHPLALFAALGSDAGVGIEEDASRLSAKSAAPPAANTQPDQASASGATEEPPVPGSTTGISEQLLGSQSTVEQQLWQALLAHNQAVIDKQDAEAKAEELTKQVDELKQQLESSLQQLDSSRAQHSTAAQQASHLGDGLRDLQAESLGLSELTQQLQQLAWSVSDHKTGGRDHLKQAGVRLEELEHQQHLEWEDYQALIASSTAERMDLTLQLAECRAELSAANDQLLNARAAIQAKSVELDAAMKRGDGLESDLRQARDQCVSVTEDLQSTKAQLGSTEEELAAVKTALTTCEQDLESSRTEAANLKDALDKSTAREAGLQSELAESRASEVSLQSELAASRASEASLQSELATSRASEASLQSELAASQESEASLQSELAASRASEASLQSELAASRTSEAKLQSELAASQESEASLQSELAASRESEASLQSELAASRASEASLQSELQASQTREASMKSDLQTSCAREEHLKTALHESEAREAGVSAALTASRASESDLKSKLFAAESRLSSLSSEMQAVLTELGSLSWQDLSATFASMQSSQREVTDKCGNLHGLSTELEEETLTAATSFMELQEDLNESEDALREMRAERQALASRCEILKQSNTRMKAEAEETAEELRELRHERQQLTSMREIMRQENVALESQVKSLTEGKQKAEAAEQQLAEHVQLLEKQLVGTKGAAEKLEAAKVQLEESKASLEQQVNSLRSESSSHAAAAAAHRTECVQLRKEVDVLQSQLSTAHSNMEQLSSKTGALRGAVASISADAACLLELRQQLSQQLAHGRQLTQHLNQQGEQLSKQLVHRIHSHPTLPVSSTPQTALQRPTSTTPTSSQSALVQTPVPPPQPSTPPRGSGINGSTIAPLVVPGSNPTSTSITQQSPDAWAPGTPPQLSESMAQAMMQQAELIELLESEVITLQEQVLAAQEQVTSLCSCMAALEGDNANLRELNTSLQEGLSASGAQVASLREALGQIAEVERELRTVQEGLQGMGEQTAQAVSVWPELGEVRMKVLEVETTWQSQLETNEQLRQRMLSKLTSEQMTVSELTQQLASAESQQRQLAVQVAAAGHLRVELEHELERVRSSNSDLSRDLRSAKSSNVLLESRVEEAVGELRTVRGELDHAKAERDRSAADANRLLSKHEDLQRHCNNLRNRCSELACEVEASRRASRQVQNAVRELQNLKAELHQTEMLCSFLARCTQTFSSNQTALITELQPIQQAWVSLLYSADSPFAAMSNNLSRGKVPGTPDTASDPTFLPMPPARVPDQSQLNLALKGGRELVKILMHLHTSAKTNPSLAKAFKQALSQVPMSPRLRRTTTPPSSPPGPELVRKRSTPLSSPGKENAVSPLSGNDLAIFMKMHLDFDLAQLLKQLDSSAAAPLREEPSLEQLSADVAAAKKLLTTRLQQLLQPLRQHAHAWGGSWEDLVKMLTGEEGGDNFGQPNTGSAVMNTHLQLEQLVAVTLKVLVFLCKQAAQQGEGTKANA